MGAKSSPKHRFDIPEAAKNLARIAHQPRSTKINNR